MTRTTFLANDLHVRSLAVLLVASAIGVSAHAQSAQPSGTAVAAQAYQGSQSSASSDAQEPPVPYSVAPVKPRREGFWGRVNPLARKRWVKNQIDPITGQLVELNEVNGRNSRDIKDVDSRSQAGIMRAQAAADAANKTATAAGSRAKQASLASQNAMNHVDTLSTTVNGLDTYGQLAEVDVAFRSGQPILTVDARKRLDDLADQVNGQAGYILEVEAHSPASGAVGIQNSQRLAEAVKRYLVTKHEIPVYRMHSVALGNARITTGDETEKPVRISSVHIRLMENSLAAQGSASPQSADSLTGTERP